MGEPKRPATNYTIIFGSNTFRGLSGALVKVRLGGKSRELFEATRDIERGGDSQLLLSFECRDATGKTVVKARRNKIVSVLDGLTVKEGPDGFEVTDKKGLVASLKVLGVSEVEVNGIFYVEGVPIIAMPDGLRIGGASISRSTFENCGSAIGIG